MSSVKTHQEAAVNRSDLFRIAFHEPNIMERALNIFPYRSPIRAAVESELVKIAERSPKTAEQLFKNRTPANLCPMFTVETFTAVVRACCTDRKPIMARYNIADLIAWWKTHIRSFTDTQAPAVEQMVQHMGRMFIPFTFVFPFLTMVPETDAFDRVRALIRSIFLNELNRIMKVDPNIFTALLQFSDIDLVGSFDITGKTFKTVALNDELYTQIRAGTPMVQSPYTRHAYACGLMFALRTEEEFLDYWKTATDAWRVELAKMYGKISPQLLDIFLRKYSRNDRIVNALMQHPAMPTDRLMFYALRWNETAKNLLNRRMNPKNGGHA